MRNAVSALSNALDLVDNTAWFDAQPQPVRDTLVAGTIQSVEFVYELSIKTMGRAMEVRAFSPSQVDHLGFRDMVRTAAEMGLVDDPRTWFEYRDMRNKTSHTYDEKKAREVLAKAPKLLADARALLARIDAANV
ncbi:nucleotidyltransferase substrate binding protein [uncultured Sphingomonas sp.]|uniref:nucleotidyltransferase substrate binding protein n=1 Tax=uncultured Sphingomonas sp. TaxID=158754 RepID=UPI0035C97E00